MPSFVRPQAVTAPLRNWINAALFECHDYAPLFSNIIYSLSAEYGDENGWVDARYATPGVFLRMLGPLVKAMRLTNSQVIDVLNALTANGHMERSDAGAMRMVGYADLVERNNASIVRNANSARQRENRARKIKNLEEMGHVRPCPRRLALVPQLESTNGGDND